MKIFNKSYAEAYDILNLCKDYKNECDFIEEIFSRSKLKIKTVLDLGCGTGGHALLLAKRGYKVVGIDRSKDMLDIARKKAEDAALDIDFIEGDITNIKLQQKFDAVISMFAVMSYQTSNSDLAAVCNVASKHLNEGGLFLFDCWNGLAVLTDQPVAKVREVELNKDEKIIRFTEPVLDYMNHTVEVKFKVWKVKHFQIKEETRESHLMRFLFPREIRYYLETAGFSRVEYCPFLKAEAELTEKDWNMTVIGCKDK